jgi:hypothetical protein
MKLIVAGKWEIDLIVGQISNELEEQVKKAARLANQIDQKVDYGNTRGSDGGARKSQRDAGKNL